MPRIATTVVALLPLITWGSAEAATPPKKADHAAIPQQYKAVCRSKVVRVQTEKWVELRRKQRCFTGE